MFSFGIPFISYLLFTLSFSFYICAVYMFVQRKWERRSFNVNIKFFESLQGLIKANIPVEVTI